MLITMTEAKEVRSKLTRFPFCCTSSEVFDHPGIHSLTFQVYEQVLDGWNGVFDPHHEPLRYE